MDRSRRACATLMRPQLRPTLRAKRLGLVQQSTAAAISGVSHTPRRLLGVLFDRAAQAAARVSPAVGLLRTARRVGVGRGDHAVTVALTCLLLARGRTRRGGNASTVK